MSKKQSGRSIYLVPTIESDMIEPILLAEWCSSQKHMDSWTISFDQVKAASEYRMPVNKAALETAEEDERKAMVFKTPRAKNKMAESTIEIEISPYSPVRVEAEDFTDLTSNQKFPS